MTSIGLQLERLRNTFWALPAIGIALAIAAALVLPYVDGSVSLPDAISFDGGPDTARTLLQMIATVAVTVAGISFSVIVVALVLASQQLSPRVMRSFQRHPLNQAVLGVFLATAAFSLFVLGAVEDVTEPVPELSVTVAMAMAAASFSLFVFFLHHMVRSLNASAVIRRIAAEGHEAIDAPYPAEAGRAPDDPGGAEGKAAELVEGSVARQVRAQRAGYLAFVEAGEILAAAERCDGFVEQRLAIGDFAVTAGVLATVWCSQSDLDELAEAVCGAFVLDEERIVGGDTAFPLRQLADVALKGLSPGVNDPTTAENAMDSIADTLVRVARQPAPAMVRLDSSGTPRLRATAPDLDDLVRIGFDQVGRDGASRPSFALRLLELLAQLRELGGTRAHACGEIAFQARAIAERAIAMAEIESDAEAVRRHYERLHGRTEGRDILSPAGQEG